jgi:hypothetical protein
MAAFAQDVLTRIVNLHLGGAIFVMGDSDGQIFYSDGSSAELNKVFVIGTTHASSPPGKCNGASAALVGEAETLAIVVGGHEHAFDHIDPVDGQELGHFTIGKIAYSTNGVRWQKAMFDMGGELTESTTVLKIIWDNNFYCFALRSGAEGDFTSECWSSADGNAWSKISSAAGSISPTFESHCKYKDGSGAGFGDGEFGIDPSKKGSGETFRYGKVVADGLLITKEDMNLSPVTFADGAWGRANFTEKHPSELEMSTDSGANWSVVGQITAYDEEDAASGTILTLIAAPKPTNTSSGKRPDARL